MAAPMLLTFSYSSLTKKNLKSLILADVLIVLVIFCVTFVPFNRNSEFDLVSNSLTSVKLIAAATLVVHLAISLGICKREHKNKLSYVVKDIARCVAVFGVSVLIFHCNAVLFGAPFFDKTAETFHLAMILASSTVGPMLIYFGLSADTWLRIFIFQSAEAGVELVVYVSTLCSLAGAWLGALPIPLDWDRPWQIWPVTCVLGTVIGHCLGILLSTIYLGRHYYKSNKTKST